MARDQSTVFRRAHSTASRRRCHQAGSGESAKKRALAVTVQGVPQREKPRSGPVSRVLSLGVRGDGHLSRTPIARRLQQPTRESMANRTGSRSPRRAAPCLVLLRVGFAKPAESPRLRCALTAPFHPYLIRGPRQTQAAAIGGVFSVALSLASRPVGVTDHPVLRSPDFPPAASRSRATSAGDRPVHFETYTTGRTFLERDPVPARAFQA